MDETGNLPAVETHEPAEPHCHNCGARHDRFQEYCLECGARLAPLPQFAGGPGSPYWFWASLIALLVLALITAAVVIAATDDDGAGTSSGVSTLPATVVPTGLTTQTLGPPTLPTSSGFVPTVPSTTFATTTAPTTTAPTTTQPGTTTNASGLTQWPAGKSGYTAILESVPASQGKAVAEQKAQAAKNKGLSEVGVLDSDNFQGLTANLWVVFSGVKNTQSDAQQNVTAAKSAGYSSAYVRQIVPK